MLSRPITPNTDSVVRSYRLPVPLRMIETTSAPIGGSNATSAPAALVAQTQSPGQKPGPNKEWASESNALASPFTAGLPSLSVFTSYRHAAFPRGPA